MRVTILGMIEWFRVVYLKTGPAGVWNTDSLGIEVLISCRKMAGSTMDLRRAELQIIQKLRVLCHASGHSEPRSAITFGFSVQNS